MVAQEEYGDVEQILASRSAADDMQFGRILYDTDGWLAEKQSETRAQYLQPEWVSKRIEALLRMTPDRLDLLGIAVESDDPLHILIHAGRVFAGLTYLPLLYQGLQASSTRNMIQLATVEPELASRLCQVEGSTAIRDEEVESALAAFSGLTALDASHDYQTLAGYMVGKAEWLAGNGYPRAAVHMGWLHSSNRAMGCEMSSGVAITTKASEFAQEWLLAVGWVGQDLLVEKLAMMAAIWEDVESSVAFA
jgi:hypothetical protein